jgi:O-antigen biosynthesis protein
VSSNSRAGAWDVVIVNYNGSLFLDPCLRALARTVTPPARVIVVDNASTDDSLLELNGWPSVEVIASPENLGYAGGANLGIRSTDAEVVVVLNPDVEVDSEFGRSLEHVFKRHTELGVAGAKLRFTDSGRIQHAGGTVNWPELTTSHIGHGMDDDGQFDEREDISYVTGAAIAIRRVAFEATGGFDESFYPAYWEDVDFCWRVRQAGWAVRYEPALAGIHVEGAGSERGDDYYRWFFQNRMRFAAKHLTSEQWWREFVPSEVNRIRGELSAVDSLSWTDRTGAGTIESIARSGSIPNHTTETILDPGPLLRSIEAISPLAGMADPAPPPLGPADGVSRRLKRFLSRFSGRLYAEELYWQQRQFNEQVARALEAQDRLNREIVAELLLTLLLLTRRTPDRLPSDDGRSGR